MSKSTSTTATTDTTVIKIADIIVSKKDKLFGEKQGKAFAAAEKKIGEWQGKQKVVFEDILGYTSGAPTAFARVMAPLVANYARDDWNSANTHFKAVAKECGYKVSLTSDRDASNKHANLIKCSIRVYGDAEKAADKVTRDTAKKAKDEKAASDKAAEIQTAVDSAVAGMTPVNSMAYPTTDKTRLALIKQLLQEGGAGLANKSLVFANDLCARYAAAATMAKADKAAAKDKAADTTANNAKKTTSAKKDKAAKKALGQAVSKGQHKAPKAPKAKKTTAKKRATNKAAAAKIPMPVAKPTVADKAA